MLTNTCPSGTGVSMGKVAAPWVRIFAIVAFLVGAGSTLGAPGDPDTAFNPPLMSGGFPVRICAILLEPDGKILIGGNFATVGGTNCAGVARLNADGSLDPSFAPTNVPPDVRALALDSKGGVLVGIGYPSPGRSSLLRLDAEGASDKFFENTFLNSAARLQGVLSLLLQADGRILVGGGTLPSSTSHLVRVQTNGLLDNSFASSVANDYVERLAPGANGRFFAGGSFTSPGPGLALLQTNGLPTTFNANLGTNPVIHGLAAQPGGPLLVGGIFVRDLFTNVICLNTNGEVYGIYGINYRFGANGPVTSVAWQGDKMLVAGDFTSLSGWACNGLVRLQPNGDLDTGFSPAAGAGLRHPVLAVQADGAILVAGASPEGRAIRRLLPGDAPPPAPCDSNRAV